MCIRKRRLALQACKLKPVRESKAGLKPVTGIAPMRMSKLFPVYIGAILLLSCSESQADKQTRNIAPDELEQSAAIFTYDSGLSIGTRVPLRVVVTSDTRETNLEEVLEDGPIVLFFTRSVEWCGFCQAQLKAVEHIIPELEKRGYQAIAVSYDTSVIQQQFLENQKLSIKMLSDEPSALIDAFELRDPQFSEGRAAGVPYATIMVIGKNGRIKNKTVSGNHAVRPRNDQILDLVNSI